MAAQTSPKKKKKATRSKDAPEPDCHLKINGQTLPWIEQDTILAMNKQAAEEKVQLPFPSVELQELPVGSEIYVAYSTKAMDNTDTTTCYYAKIIHQDKNTKSGTVHFADASYLSGLEKDKEYTDDVEHTERVYVIRKNTKKNNQQRNINDNKEQNQHNQNEHDNKNENEQNEKERTEQKKQFEKNIANMNAVIEKMRKEQETQSKVIDTIRFDTQTIKGNIITMNNQIGRPLRRMNMGPPPPPPPPPNWPQLPPPPPQQPLPQQHPPKDNPDTELTVSPIPYDADEDLQKIIKAIATYKNLILNDADFETFRAISKNRPADQNPNERPPNIVVKFTDIQTRANFKRRTENQITLADILPNSNSTQKIYINERLPANQNKLYYQTRRFKRENNYRSAWTYNGLIYLRKTEFSARIQVTSITDLEHLEHQHRHQLNQQQRIQQLQRQQQQRQQQQQQPTTTTATATAAKTATTTPPTTTTTIISWGPTRFHLRGDTRRSGPPPPR